jgi:hypothetical protein
MKHTTAISLLIIGTACGEPAPAIRGQLDLAALGRTSGTIVAARDDGTLRGEPIGSDGRIELELEPNHAYTFAFEDRGRYFARLVFERETEHVAMVRVNGDLELGTVRPVDGADDSSCRDMAGDSPDIALSRSLLVSGDVAPDPANTIDDSGDTFDDSDQDGVDDVFDEDRDDDGICDDGDDDPGDDAGEDGGSSDGDEGEADLPYDVRLEIGDTFTLIEAFDEKGVRPSEILDVEMDGSTWRLEELRSGTSFVVSQDDCDHEGNRGPARDRIFVAWTNPNGTRAIDHLDLRYCGR